MLVLYCTLLKTLGRFQRRVFDGAWRVCLAAEGCQGADLRDDHEVEGVGEGQGAGAHRESFLPPLSHRLVLGVMQRGNELREEGNLMFKAQDFGTAVLKYTQAMAVLQVSAASLRRKGRWCEALIACPVDLTEGFDVSDRVKCGCQLMGDDELTNKEKAQKIAAIIPVLNNLAACHLKSNKYPDARIAAQSVSTRTSTLKPVIDTQKNSVLKHRVLLLSLYRPSVPSMTRVS
jgi:hypothetical protein